MNKKEFIKLVKNGEIDDTDEAWGIIYDSIVSQAQSEHNQDCTREEWARADERGKLVKEIRGMKPILCNDNRDRYIENIAVTYFIDKLINQLTHISK